MRGQSKQQVSMLTLRSPEQIVPKDHPIRMGVLVDKVLADLSPVFDAMYSSKGRPSVPPERLLKSLLLIAFFSVRNERLFCEQLAYNMLFRWFLDMGKEAKLAYCTNALMENRNGLVVSILVATATGRAERESAVAMLEDALPGARQVTLGADKGYDVHEFVDDCRSLNVTPHVSQNLNANGGSAIDQRTTRHPGYAVSQRVRKRIEEIWGWMKTIGGFRKTRFRGLERTQLAAHLVASAYHLLLIGRLLPT